MKFIAVVGQNVILMSSLTAWFLAQVLKTLTASWKEGKFNA